jgi:hypothetical protein
MGGAWAGHAMQTLGVSARVSPSALIGFEVSAQPLEITAADLQRGYVEVVMKSRMHVAAPNGGDSRPAVVMAIEPRTDLFRGMTLSHSGNGHGNGNGHSTAAVAAPEEKPHQAFGGQLTEFRYRFEFSKTAREGSYATAISVSIDL